MNHGLAQILGGGLPSRLAKRDIVGFTIVVDHQRVVHGNIRRPLFKVSYRIAAGRHHIAQKLVGFRYRTPGAVNEPPLDVAPRLGEPRPIVRGKRTDVESLDSLITPIELCLRMTPAPATCQGAGILGATKLRAQPFRPAPAENQQPGNACNHNHPECNDQTYFYWT